MVARGKFAASGRTGSERDQSDVSGARGGWRTYGESCFTKEIEKYSVSRRGIEPTTRRLRVARLLISVRARLFPFNDLQPGSARLFPVRPPLSKRVAKSCKML